MWKVSTDAVHLISSRSAPIRCAGAFFLLHGAAKVGVIESAKRKRIATRIVAYWFKLQWDLGRPALGDSTLIIRRFYIPNKIAEAGWRVMVCDPSTVTMHASIMVHAGSGATLEKIKDLSPRSLAT